MGRVKGPRRKVGLSSAEETAGGVRTPQRFTEEQQSGPLATDKAARRIRYYGDPVLRIPARKVLAATPFLLSFVHEMIETLAHADGLGLAAQQVGEPIAVTVLNLEGFEGVDEKLTGDGVMLVLLNPEIAEEEGIQTDEEGCLSFPGLYVNLSRPERVVVRGQRLVGERVIPLELEARGLFARALCHEIDHLAGRLIIDRLSPFARVRVLTQWRLKLAEALRDSGQD